MELLIRADKLIGGSDAVLVVDDTAIPKKGTHSVGVLRNMLGAGQDRQLPDPGVADAGAREVPVMLALRLFLPEGWTSDRVRLKRAGIPAEYRTARTRPELALMEIDRAVAAGVRFGCVLRMWLRDERAVPSALSSQVDLGGRYPAPS